MHSKTWLFALVIILLGYRCYAIKIVEDSKQSSKSAQGDDSKEDEKSESSEKTEDLDSNINQSGEGPDVDLESGDSAEPDIDSGLGDKQKSGLGDDIDLESGDSQEPDLESGDSQEPGPDEEDSKSKTKPTFKHPLAWIKHSRNGDTDHASSEDVQKLSAYITSHISHDCFVSQGAGDSSHDGRMYSMKEHKKEKRTSEPLRESRNRVNDVRQYPGYAIGRLDNECSAFLIGPYHAITLAHCVLNRYGCLRWKEGLNFLRGRDKDNYLQEMEWESVYIPQAYFHRGRLVNRGRSWAVIEFKKDNPSPVWLPFSYCPGKAFSSANQVSAYGYYYTRWYYGDLADSNKMSFIDCSIRTQMHCPTQHTFQGYLGGPVIIKHCELPYDIKGMTTPPVVGINGRRNSCYGAQVVGISSEIFWSICFLLSDSGHNPVCTKWLADTEH